MSGEGKVVGVTGASGFIASWLVKLLLDHGYTVKASLWYILSKTLAEEAAWKFAKENRLDLITINPGFVIGPILQPTINLTVELILNIVTGRELPPHGVFMDVRDVAHAHIQAFEIPSATGRYCMVESTVDVTELWKILHRLFPIFHLNEKFEDKPIQNVFQISKEKIKSLGFNFIPLEHLHSSLVVFDGSGGGTLTIPSWPPSLAATVAAFISLQWFMNLVSSWTHEKNHNSNWQLE
ncbi:hypothetical protein SLEP1_g23743 [Rubroshorea leprosula]|uniref:Uncharacterized protein n=1 Tax=Rubroshorea leprosula TaxID=152421 RepID=A0AAV5JIJ8_9ROSI|nr:hypothetical protein SLEP1_g23743 [Rubroshorea leprosula]